jgi:hypothetical protein
VKEEEEKLWEVNRQQMEMIIIPWKKKVICECHREIKEKVRFCDEMMKTMKEKKEMMIKEEI